MKKTIAVVVTMLLFASICPARGKDVVVDSQPTTPTKINTLTQTEPVFGLMEKNLDRGSFKSFKDKVPAILNTTTGPSCGCSGPHDCCSNSICVKQCR